MFSGSAPIEPEVLSFLKVVFCCPVLEGYGLTETAAGICATRSNDITAGHVGGPAGLCKFRLLDLPDMNYSHNDKPYPRGELCVKSASMFLGYYKKPEKTAEAFDEKGWFKTGDVVMVLPNGAV